jgi:hypothetical protein
MVDYFLFFVKRKQVLKSSGMHFTFLIMYCLIFMSIFAGIYK